MIDTVIFDYGGVISSPLFVGIEEFEAAEGYPRGSLLRLIFGETEYVGVVGRRVAAEIEAEIVDAVAADPDAVEGHGEVEDEPDWHLLEKGRIDVATYFERLVARAPRVLGRPLDMDAYGRFWQRSAPGVHWMVVHKMRELKAQGRRIAILTNNVKEFGEHWRATFPLEELCDDVIDSSHVGMRKPEPAIYRLTCDRLGIEPGDAVFLDDNLDNIVAAQAFGLHTVHVGEDPWRALDELDALLRRA